MQKANRQPSEVLNAARALTCCGSSTLAQEACKRYLAFLPAARVDLERAHDKHDLDTVQFRAHRLRSISHYIGAEPIATAAQVLEERILASAPQQDITAAWLTLCQEINAVLDQPAEALLALL